MKRKILFIICLTIVSLQIKAQLSYNKELIDIDSKTTFTDETLLQFQNFKINQNSRFYIGLMSSLDINKSKFNSLFNTQETTNDYAGFHLGLKVQYDFNKKFSLRSGISFSKVEYKYDISKVLVPIESGDPLLIANNGIWTQKTYYLNIPVMVGYTIFSKGNFKLTPSTGYIVSFMVDNKTNDSYNNNFHKIIHSIQFNIGCEYLINNKFLITLEPYLNYKLNNTEDPTWIVISNSLNYGGIISVNYHF